MGRLGLALFFFVFSVYILTMGGHTYSPDEETMVYITQTIVTRGALDVPDYGDKPVEAPYFGIGGKYYAPTSLDQSLAEIPFYLVGDAVARAFDPRFHDYLVRLAIGLLNPLLTALTALLLFILARRMGFSSRVSLGLALALAFTTMAWVYAKTTFAEPIGGLLILAAFYSARVHAETRSLASAVCAGAFTGAAVLGKYSVGVVAPLVALYFISGVIDVAALRPSFPRLLKSSLAFGLPALLMLAVLLGYNYVRFGNALDFGNVLYLGNWPQNLYGLLISPGKGFFLFAPVGILSLFGLKEFGRRLPREAALVLSSMIVSALYLSRYTIWYGGGSWGPRYLMPILPMWVLPAAVVFEQARRWNWAGVLVTLTLVGGLAVQLLGVTINFDAYVNAQPNDQARFFEPSQSPIVGHARMLTERLSDWWSQTFPNSDGVALRRGFLNTASPDAPIFPRYITDQADLRVYAPSELPVHLTFRFTDYRAADLPRRSVSFRVNGEGIAVDSSSVSNGANANYVTIPASHSRGLDVSILTQGSAGIGTSPMGDELGLEVNDIQIRTGEDDLPFFKDISIPPLPVAIPKAAWGWFFYPGFEHFDFWWWYLYFSGLPDRQVLALALPLLLFGLVGLTLSSYKLARFWRCA